MKFRKKPVVIDAVQWTGENQLDLLILGMPQHRFARKCGGILAISTLEGIMSASPGDWIIKGVQGEFYPCKPDIFEATYEKAD